MSNPFPFQVECGHEIDWFRGRALCALDMGLGKTALALQYIVRSPRALPAVVVCPASVKYHWEAEALQHANIRAVVVEGRKPHGIRRGLVIINYDVLRYWVKTLNRMHPNTVIIDESQYIASYTAQRSKAVRSLCRGVPHVLALSGTPLLNRPLEIYSTVKLLCPNFMDKRSFMDRFCVFEWTPWGRVYKYGKNLDELNKLLVDCCLIRRRKVDVLTDLPAKTRYVVPVPITKRSQYELARNDFGTWLKRYHPDSKATTKATQDLAKIGYLLRLAAKLKMPYVGEWINTFLEDTDEKLLVFATHKEIISEVRRLAKCDSVAVDGSITGRARQAAVDRFVESKQVRMLVGNIQAAGTGINRLQYACSTAAFVELPWRPGDVIQAEDRLWRIGSKSEVDIYYIVAHNTIEEKLCSLLQDKQDTVSLVVDGGVHDGDLDIMTQLRNSLNERNKK